MGNSFQIGKIFGISIRIDFTWFIVFALIALSLSTHYFPSEYEGWPTSTYWVLGIITALVFFASVLAHELAHSLVSKARGIPVDSITLFIFGGVARISDEPKNPGGEFLMAIAGPATSVAIGVIFGAIYYAVGRSNSPFSALTAWVARINIIVAVFNMIPGFPLDGGRVFRSIVWRITGNLRKATRIASSVGKVVAYIFILLGIWSVINGNWFGGIWIAFIGWFLLNAANTSYRQMAVREMLSGVKVRQVMNNQCNQLPKGLVVKDFVDEHILKTAGRCFPIVDKDEVLGIITLHSAKEVPKEKWETTRIEEVMTPFDEMKSVSPDDEIYTVMQHMTEEGYNQLPVVENGQLVGMIARDNLVGYLNARLELDR
ncbi:CBS domain-containing protein [Candidatus Poribacteria bacterium]|nr:CBS domain-containing protein [Candidatus Poribacteria bacterium]